MRFTVFCCFVVGITLVFLAGCNRGDTGESVGNDAKKLSDTVFSEISREPDLQKVQKIAADNQPKMKAIHDRYEKLSAEEKKKAEAIFPGFLENPKK